MNIKEKAERQVLVVHHPPQQIKVNETEKQEFAGWQTKIAINAKTERRVLAANHLPNEFMAKKKPYHPKPEANHKQRSQNRVMYPKDVGLLDDRGSSMLFSILNNWLSFPKSLYFCGSMSL